MLHSVSHQTSLVFELFFGETERDGVLYFERVLPVEVLEQCCSFHSDTQSVHTRTRGIVREGKLGYFMKGLMQALHLILNAALFYFLPSTSVISKGRAVKGGRRRDIQKLIESLLLSVRF